MGEIFRHRPGRTVGEADNVFFSTLTMNTQSLHLDEAFAASSEFGQRLVNSMFTLATIVGLSVSDLTEGTTVANLGFDEIRFPLPLFHGDTLYAETEVVSQRLSRSRPGNGLVVFEHRGTNQHDQVVATARRTALMIRRPASVASGPNPP